MEYNNSIPKSQLNGDSRCLWEQEHQELWMSSFFNSGKGSVGTENCSSEGSVMRLVKHFHQHKYHTLCFDNWFTTLLLMLKLKALGIIALGTIRSNRIQFVRWTRKKNWRNLGVVHLHTSTINPLLLFTQDWNNSTMWGLWKSGDGSMSLILIYCFDHWVFDW